MHMNQESSWCTSSTPTMLCGNGGAWHDPAVHVDLSHALYACDLGVATRALYKACVATSLVLVRLMNSARHAKPAPQTVSIGVLSNISCCILHSILYMITSYVTTHTHGETLVYMSSLSLLLVGR